MGAVLKGSYVVISKLTINLTYIPQEYSSLPRQIAVHNPDIEFHNNFIFLSPLLPSLSSGHTEPGRRLFSHIFPYFSFCTWQLITWPWLCLRAFNLTSCLEIFPFMFLCSIIKLSKSGGLKWKPPFSCSRFCKVGRAQRQWLVFAPHVLVTATWLRLQESSWQY